MQNEHNYCHFMNLPILQWNIFECKYHFESKIELILECIVLVYICVFFNTLIAVKFAYILYFSECLYSFSIGIRHPDFTPMYAEISAPSPSIRRKYYSFVSIMMSSICFDYVISAISCASIELVTIILHSIFLQTPRFHGFLALICRHTTHKIIDSLSLFFLLLSSALLCT